MLVKNNTPNIFKLTYRRRYFYIQPWQTVYVPTEFTRDFAFRIAISNGSLIEVKADTEGTDARVHTPAVTEGTQGTAEAPVTVNTTKSTTRKTKTTAEQE